MKQAQPAQALPDPQAKRVRLGRQAQLAKQDLLVKPGLPDRLVKRDRPDLPDLPVLLDRPAQPGLLETRARPAQALPDRLVKRVRLGRQALLAQRVQPVKQARPGRLETQAQQAQALPAPQAKRDQQDLPAQRLH